MMFGALVAPMGHVRSAVRDCLAKSVAFDPSEDLEEILDDIDAGHLVAWVASDGERLHSVTVTEILENAKGKRCFIRQCARAEDGAPLSDWLSFLPIIEGWAMAEGCTSVDFLGRKGWERALPEYQKQAILLRKTLVADKVNAGVS